MFKFQSKEKPTDETGVLICPNIENKVGVVDLDKIWLVLPKQKVNPLEVRIGGSNLFIVVEPFTDFNETSPSLKLLSMDIKAFDSIVEGLSEKMLNELHNGDNFSDMFDDDCIIYGIVLNTNDDMEVVLQTKAYGATKLFKSMQLNSEMSLTEIELKDVEENIKEQILNLAEKNNIKAEINFNLLVKKLRNSNYSNSIPTISDNPLL